MVHIQSARAQSVDIRAAILCSCKQAAAGAHPLLFMILSILFLLLSLQCSHTRQCHRPSETRVRPILAWQAMRCRGGGETDDQSTSDERPTKLMKTMQCSTDRVDGAPGNSGNYKGNETALAEPADAPAGGHLPSVADSPEHEKVHAADTASTMQDPEMEILKEALSAGPLDAHPVAMAEVTSVSAVEGAAPKAKKIRGPGPVQLPEPPPPPDHAALVAAQAIGESVHTRATAHNPASIAQA